SWNCGQSTEAVREETELSSTAGRVEGDWTELARAEPTAPANELHTTAAAASTVPARRTTKWRVLDAGGAARRTRRSTLMPQQSALRSVHCNRRTHDSRVGPTRGPSCAGRRPRANGSSGRSVSRRGTGERGVVRPP